MEWDRDAVEAVERAPFFVRRMVRKRVEEAVAASGGRRVTLAAVQSCRLSFLSGQARTQAPPVPTPTPIVPSPAEKADMPPLSEQELRAIERLTAEKAGVETRYYAVQACGAVAGCPLSQAEVGGLSDGLARRIAASGVAEHLQRTIRGPLLTHHRFRAAVAGCANNCCEPQIKDFAVIARARPGRGPGECIDCARCLEVCREDAVALADGPVFAYDRCLNCGRCAAECATGAIAVVERSYTILVGGKLGRHAQLAEVLADAADEETVYRALDACLELYLAEARGPERLGAVLNRTGLAPLRAKLGLT